MKGEGGLEGKREREARRWAFNVPWCKNDVGKGVRKRVWGPWISWAAVMFH